MGSSQFPVLTEGFSIHRSPFEHQGVNPPGKAAFGDIEGVDPIDGGMIPVVGVEVRRRMIVVVHANHDPEKGRDGRHVAILPRLLLHSEIALDRAQDFAPKQGETEGDPQEVCGAGSSRGLTARMGPWELPSSI